MRQYKEQQQPQESVFGSAFNTQLHPLDSLTFLQATQEHLRQFSSAFKERIQAQIQYSKSLIKVSKLLSKHVNVSRPSPISYISSAFKVQHELRARHALELAQYLHTQIQIPCEQLLQKTGLKLKQISQDLKKQYKQGQNFQQAFQKYSKKYQRSRQEWQERMITKTILPYVPGVLQHQIQKANAKVLEQKQQYAQILNKYVSSMSSFNKFAKKFNSKISQFILAIEINSKKHLTIQTNSLRKLIVSEINMFENIKYDMINISKQMEGIKPNDQLQIFLKEHGSVFDNPILSIYSDGPILQDNWHSIDLKYPITHSLLEETLSRIQRKNFNWMLENKHNSTFKYALAQAWKKFEGLQAENFMEDLQQCVVKNKTIKEIPAKSDEKQYFLNSDQVFSVSFSIVTTLASFIRPLRLPQEKISQKIAMLRNCIALHHFYRFFTVISLEQYLNLRQNILQSKIEEKRLVMVVKLLIKECIKSKDVFVMRSIIAIMFQTQLGKSRVSLHTKDELINNDIWSNNDFWQSIIFQATFEQLSLLPTVTKSQLKQIYLMRSKNIIFSTLATHCHYMVMLRCNLEQIKAIAGRFCHIYSLSEEHSRDLSKTIRTSTEKLAKLTHDLAQNIESDDDEQNLAFDELFTSQKTQLLKTVEDISLSSKSTSQLQPNLASVKLQQLKKQQSNQEKSTNQNLQFQKGTGIIKSKLSNQ